MKFFNPKNIMKNGVRVMKGTAGAYASDLIANKAMSKIPKIGEKPVLKHLATAIVGIMAMDIKGGEDFGFGAAVTQVREAGYTMPKIKEYMGVSDELSDDVVSEIEAKVEEDIKIWKEQNPVNGAGTTLSDEPTFGTESNLSDEPSYGLSDPMEGMHGAELTDEL